MTEALEQQTATADILRVIASSPTDLQPVFDTIVERALRLCDGLYSGVYQLDGDLLRLVAHNQTGTEAEAMLRGGYPRPLSREGLIGRAILERRVIHVSDIESDPDASERSRSRSRLLGFRSFLGVPMLREGRPIGAIRVNRSEPRPFSDREIALLQTFADQAVIAIENVRLFNETKDATWSSRPRRAKILKVISRSTFDLQPVLETLIENATRLCGAQHGFIFRSEGEAVPPRGGLQRPSGARGNRRTVTRFGRGDGSVVGRAALERAGHPHPRCAGRHRLACSERRSDGHERASGRFLAYRCVREGVLIGVIAIVADGGSALHGQADRAGRDLRRPGRDRHRERSPPPGAAGPDPRADAVGGGAEGARARSAGRSARPSIWRSCSRRS